MNLLNNPRRIHIFLGSTQSSLSASWAGKRPQFNRIHRALQAAETAFGGMGVTLQKQGLQQRLDG